MYTLQEGLEENAMDWTQALILRMMQKWLTMEEDPRLNPRGYSGTMQIPNLEAGWRTPDVKKQKAGHSHAIGCAKPGQEELLLLIWTAELYTHRAGKWILECLYRGASCFHKPYQCRCREKGLHHTSVWQPLNMPSAQLAKRSGEGNLMRRRWARGQEIQLFKPSMLTEVRIATSHLSPRVIARRQWCETHI